MDTPDNVTSESQKKLWDNFESSVQEFRSSKKKKDAEFQARLDKLRRGLANFIL